MANLSDFRVGDVVLTYGLDMACHKCVCKTKVVKIDERGIVTKSDEDDFSILATWNNMQHFNDYFLYSEEQEKAMQEQCDNEYNEWREACRKQEERAHQYYIEWTESLKKLIREKGYFDGTHTIFELSEGHSFFRWKKYDILHINEHLDCFGMADDEDTMFLNIDELPAPTQMKIKDEVEKGAA